MNIYLNNYWSYSSETFIMGKKQDLTSCEKDEIVRLLGKGISKLQIAKDTLKGDTKGSVFDFFYRYCETLFENFSCLQRIQSSFLLYFATNWTSPFHNLGSYRLFQNSHFSSSSKKWAGVLFRSADSSSHFVSTIKLFQHCSNFEIFIHYKHTYTHTYFMVSLTGKSGTF